MTALLARLAAMLPWILGGTAVLIALILAYVVVLLRRARAAAAPPAAPRTEGDAGGAISSVLHLRRSFTEGVEALRSYVPGKDHRYRIPWILMLGEGEAGKSTVLRNLGLDRPFAAPDDADTGEAGCRWAFFNQGVVLEVPGDLFLRPGGGADEVGWKTLLRLLQEHRTERPVDGIVLAVPSTDLLGPGAPGKEELAAKAEAAFERLWDAQKVLGMRLPVTVLVTKCDRVPGFRSFCERLPEAFRDEVFGWSSPYPVDAAFAPEWVDEAFDALHEGLYETQVELLSQADGVGDPDALFRFPGELRRMHLPLRAYLREVFQRTVYHESFFFRGICFTGDEHAAASDAFAAAADALPAEAPAEGRGRHPVFLEQLFREKVFPEGGLARPLPQALLHRNRRVRMAQVAILAIGILGGAGLWYSHGRLAGESAKLTVALRDIEGDLRQVERLREGGGQVRWAEVEVFRLVQEMAAVRTARLWSTLMPTSWPSGIRSEIRASMAAGLSEVVFPATRDALLQKADSLLPAGEGGSAPTGYVGRATGARDVYRYVADLRRLNDAVRRYNGLTQRDSADVRELGPLLEYAFGRDVPDLSARDAHFYSGALRAATAPRIGPEEGARTRIAAMLADTLVRRTYDDLGRKLDRLGDHSRALGGVRFASAGSLDDFRTLNQDINDVQGFFADSETFWLDGEAPLDPALDALLDSIGRTPLLDGPAFRREFTRRFRDARVEKLREMRTGVESSGGGGMSLYAGFPAAGDTAEDARGALVLRDALRTLQKQSFSGPESAVSLRAAPPPGMTATWDPAYLDRALLFYADYDRFLQGALRDLPVGSQGFIRGLAAVQLEAKMTRTIAQGLRYTPAAPTFGQRNAARELRERIAVARPAAERAVRLLGVFRQTGLRGPYEELAATLLAQDEALLRETDRLLESSGLYAPRGGDFAWWSGSRPVAPAAFGAEDAEGVEEYLAAQRGQVRGLLDAFAAPVLADLQAEPLREYVASGDAAEHLSPTLVEKWRAIGAQLDAYEAKTPGNSLAALEQFVRDEMNAAEPGSCAAGGRTARAGDYFLQARERLRASLQARCAELGRTVATSGYARLQEQFQRSLAGRFPFAARDAEVGDASAAAVRDFFRTWDETAAARRAVAGGGGSPAAEWLAQMERVRAFLAPLLADGGAAPGYAVAAEFRANRAREAGGDQVAAWSLDLGGFRLTPWDSAGSTVPWEPGAPARLALRWASESEVRPTPGAITRGGRVQDRTVTWAYGGEWGLLRLLRRSAAAPADLAVPAARARYTLRLDVPTLRNVPGADTLAGPPARVFVRLRLLHPETREEYTVPDFPSHAPFLRASRGDAPAGGRTR